VTRSKLPFTWLVVLLTQFTAVICCAQNSLIKTALETPNHVSDDVTTSTLTSPQPTESATAPLLLPPEPKALSTRNPKKLGIVDRAYLDAFTILNDDNPCSRFFGGRNAIKALTEMVSQVKTRYFDREVAIRMSGATTMIQSQATGFTFRLFDKVELNMAGSFFRTPAPTERYSSITREFPPNSRETRVVVFLHELGHLVRTRDGQWVLSDDGDDPIRSLQNTDRVVSACKQQIASLAGLTAEQELEMTSANLAQKIPSAP
jgi:hypothetical protein